MVVPPVLSLPVARFNSRYGMRQFDSGATRDSDEGKFCYEGFLSPLVLSKFAEYMHGHRVQSNGELRAPDNWQKHFGERHFSVCMDSLLRHVMDMWLEHRGHKSREGIENAIMGVMFNVMAYADKYYKDKMQ